jgi:limonene 1,2-monooxygenase
MQFGMFMAPFHTTVQNPTLALERDLQHIQLLDDLGFDEVWIGEHHSAGAELISSPEVFIAAAAARTKRIRLGTGVVSLPYHHPMWVADRALLLDHLTRGRFMLGVGPGSLPTDAAMIGLEPEILRPRLDDGVAAILHLLTSDEPLTMKTDGFVLENAVTQLRPYSSPLFDVAVPSVASPTGARLAGKYGISLLSIGAAAAQGIDVFAQHWDVVETMAAQHGHETDRSKWRVVAMVHLAETEAQAREDVKFGIVDWFRYFQRVAAFPQMALPGDTADEMVDFVNDNGLGVIGTPEMLVELLKSWNAQSGGFGVCLIMHHDWANDAATRQSHELLARFVMPEFQGQAARLRARRDAAIASREALADKALAAVEASTKAYAEEVTSDEFRGHVGTTGEVQN